MKPLVHSRSLLLVVVILVVAAAVFGAEHLPQLPMPPG